MAETTEKRCYYEVLGLPQSCTQDEIRSAYKKLALQRHPDKLIQSGLSSAAATAAFQELVRAYEVLSDPKERSWYDSHRSQILFSSTTNNNSDSPFPDLFSYFSPSCYTDYTDPNTGFYKVYGDVFDKIYGHEISYCRTMGLNLGLVKEAPLLGNLGCDYSQVNAFYGYWMGFSTVMDFGWVDKWDAAAGVNRKSRRVMEEENKKVRKKAKKEFNETVRGLAEFVKKRDKRVIDMMVRKEKERERKREEEMARRKEREREKLERARLYEEPDWAKAEDVDVEEFEEDDEEEKEEKNEFYCIACGKKFKSDRQWKNHEKSKKHKEKVEQLRKSFIEEDDYENVDDGVQLEAEAVEGVVEGNDEDEKDAAGNGFVSAAQDDANDLDENFNECVRHEEGRTDDGDVTGGNNKERNGIQPSIGGSEDESVTLEAMISGRWNKRHVPLKKVLFENNNAQSEDEVEPMGYHNKKGKKKSRRATKDKGKVPRIADGGASELVEENALNFANNGVDDQADHDVEPSTGTKAGKSSFGKKGSSKQDTDIKSKNSSKGRRQKVGLRKHRGEEVEDDIMDNGLEQDDGEEQLDDVDQALADIRAQNAEDGIVKGRGRSKGVKKNELMHLEYNELGQPDGKCSGEYGKHIGSCVLRIGINVRTYVTFDAGKKLQFWEETKLMFHIVDCPKKKKEKLFHSSVAKRFRDFKSKLVRRWITKRTKPPKLNAHLQPWEVYEDFISKEEWTTFVEYYHSSEAKERSEKARKSAMQNKHKQRTGQQGYNRKRPIWIKEGRLPPEAASILSSDSTIGNSGNTSRIKYRPVEWRLAHEICTPDGKWQIDPRDKETTEVGQKTVEFLKQQEQGLLEVSWGEDALTKAMGKKDYRGRVIGVGGVNVGYKTAFGLPDRTRSSTNGPSPEVVERIKESVQKEFEESFSARVAAEVQKYVASNKIDMSTIKTPERVYEVPRDTHMQELNGPHIEIPPRVLQVPTSCRVAINDNYGNQVIVANGLAFPTPVGVIHSVPMMKNHYRVSVDTIYSGHEDVDLPVSMGEGKTKLRDAYLTFVQWPCDLVLFEEEITSPPKKKFKSKSSMIKEKVDSNGEPMSMHSHNMRKTLFLDVDLQQLGLECASIYSLISCAPPGRYDNLTITLDAALWHFDKYSSSNISATHLNEFLRGECASIPIIQVYIMFLVHEYIHILDSSQVTFLCPFKISESELKRDNYAAIMYIKRVFEVQIKKKDKAQCKFILAPYLEKNHWTLYVIDLRMAIAFEFNSNLSENRTPALPRALNIVYQFYRFRGEVNPKIGGKTLKFIQIKCPQQQSAMDCGYYVMRFMHEIVTLHNECNGSLQKVYQERSVAYTSEELGEICEQWAMFFRNKYMLD